MSTEISMPKSKVVLLRDTSSSWHLSILSSIVLTANQGSGSVKNSPPSMSQIDASTLMIHSFYLTKGKKKHYKKISGRRKEP